jgi:hypothetical protein
MPAAGGEVRLCVWEGLVYILAHAFADCQWLGHIVIPSTVREIGEDAFLCCWHQLAEVELVCECEELDRIKTKAFAVCHWSFQYIEVPFSIKSIGNGAFSACQQLVEFGLCNNGMMWICPGCIQRLSAVAVGDWIASDLQEAFQWLTKAKRKGKGAWSWEILLKIGVACQVITAV